MLLCCFGPQVDEDEPNEARQLRKAGCVKTEKKWRRKKKKRGSEEEQAKRLVVVQKEGGMKERETVVEEEKQILEEEEEKEVIMEMKSEEQQEVHDPEEMKEEEKEEEQDVEEEVKIEVNNKTEKKILLEELNVEAAVVEEQKFHLQKVMEQLKDEKKGKKKIRMVVVVIMERKKEEKQQVLDIEEERKVMENVEVLEEVSVESPGVEEEVSVESPAVVEEQKAELENIRDRPEEEMLLEEEQGKDCVAIDLLGLPVCEESSDAASAEAELIQQLLEELLQEAVMKWTFTASDDNVEQQLQEPSDSNSSAVAQTNHCRTYIKTEWATKLKEEQEVSLALVTTDRSTCTANRADKSATEPDCESLDDGFTLDCASVMERNWLKRLRETDEQLRWSDDVHDVQRPEHHVEEQACSISGATTENIRPITADLLCLPVCEESSDAASAEAELIQHLLEELLQEAVMKWTFTASDDNVEQQMQEPSDSNSSAVAQPDQNRTHIKTEWATKLKEVQEVSLALVTTDRSTCTANRADKSATEPDCESLDDGFNLDCASVMERNWLKCLRERDEQLRWSDDVHDVQRPEHHVEEQACSISGATTENIRPIAVQINDLLLNTTPHSTLIRLVERETNTIKVPFNHSVSVRLQDCEVMMLKMKMMRKRTWSERLTELNETLPVVYPVTSHPVSLIEPLQKFISSANKHLREGNAMKLSGQTTTTLTSVYVPEKSELLLDSTRTPEEQEEVKTLRTSADNNVTDQHQEFEMQILTMKVNWGRKSREKTLRGGLFFMLPKLEVQFMHDTGGSDQEEIE
ncbi:hypothetical protein MHYP_G00270820 [Metynnis hypsauchen]